MSVRIVTDSLSDITSETAARHGITVVPVYVRFGKEIYRDRVEITTEQFYERLVRATTLPTTTQPSPNDFLQVYKKLAKESDEILVITLSSKLSGTYQSAAQAKKMMDGRTRIEVIDSETVVMGLGLIVIEAARSAERGMNLVELARQVEDAKKRSHAVMLLDTLKYLAKGGRIGKAKGLLGAMLSVKPILTIREGEVHPMTRVRSRASGIDYLYNLACSLKKIELVAVEHATTPADADKLAERLSAIVPKEDIYRSTVSPVIGTYVGPQVISISMLEAPGGK